MRDVVITFRDANRALYDDRQAKKLDLDLPHDPLARYTVEFLRGLVERTDEGDCGELLAILGRHLFEFIFGPAPGQDDAESRSTETTDARRRFEQMLTWAQQENDHFVNLRLNFEPDAWPLAVWPWEFLYYPDGRTGWTGYFLRTKRISVVREVNSQRSMETGNPPLKVLLATSGPHDLPSIDAEGIKAVLTPHEAAAVPRIELCVVQDRQFGELKREIEQFKPEVFHFHGHGDGSGGVTLPHKPRKALAELRFTGDELDEGVNTGGQTAASLFSDYQPQLVLLTACDSALGEVPFADVAQQLGDVGVGIPAVVAMQFKVRPETAISFAERFYEALIDGDPIAPAFAAGLDALTDENAEARGALGATRDFGTPVLFLNSTAGRLVARADRERAAGPALDTRVPGARDVHVCVFCGAAEPQAYCWQCGRPTHCKCGETYRKEANFCGGCGAEVRFGSPTNPPLRALPDQPDLPEQQASALP